ncbi:MAG: metallophosphoesterase [Erysipelotrichaceae bacterium]|nr:metallophosphoesterase [Erysipelotrichaceae bacterium]
MLPPKIAKHIQDAKRRYEAFDPKKEAFTFFFITDVHTGGNKNYQQYDFLFDAAKTLPAHLLVNGGDLGLDCGQNLTQETFVLNKTKEGMQQFLEPFVWLKGNHDYGQNAFSNHVLNHFFNDDFLTKSRGKGTIVFDEEYGGGYGKYEDQDKDITLFFLNTTEGNRKDFFVSYRQLHWLATSLKNIATHHVIFLSHRDIDPSGNWLGSKDEENVHRDHIDLLRLLVESFSQKRIVEVEEQTYDFSSTSSCKTLLYLCGDSHFFQDATTHDVRYVSRQGYGGVDRASMPLGASKNQYDFQKRHCFFQRESDFDYVAILPNGAGKIFHIGPDEEKRDILF